MENHPIPQDITGFQFKLIGNMTVRQFVYLAVGGVLAWLFFFMLGLPTLIKWPLAIFSLGIGAMFAFIPIDGRPMDTMMANFIKALLSPTQFVYQKEGGKLENQNIPHSQPLKLQTAMTMQAPTPRAPIPQTIAPQPTIQQAPPPPPVIQPIQASAPPPIQPPAPVFSSIPTMTIQQMDEPDDLQKKNRELEKAQEEQEKLKRELETLKKQLEDANKAKEEAAAQPAPTPAPAAPAPAFTPPTPSQDALERQLIESNRQREALEKQLLTERARANDANTPTVNPTVAAPAPSQRVRSVPPGMEKSVGIPSVPENPNLITGIVKDPRGNLLQNILIEVKDQDSNPVRAFKTNGLGKFASATSLSNGKYVITFEDTKEQHKFDAVEIELVGAPVMPLEIISVDPREELRRELFN